MKVICKINNLNMIKNQAILNILKDYYRYSDGELDLVLEKEYQVYGVVFMDNIPFVYICPDDYDEYPVPMAMSFFEVSDPTLFKHWRLSYFPLEAGEPVTILAIPDWAKDYGFYEKLIDGDAETINIFNKYRHLMDAE